eukprot:CAMPEP_0119034018 /NCGR_PEP_ID=MMETSP1177-20130426/1073_1 /TAXON_ID=2985 /ORGANISM="Ochromonas sp, Strain CCMP1899" /LENGTH=563 /DNA_ID=CAMNT_0006991195 /DNA_START=1095 /DNA_END=2786 /DNA_ORIENTATION=-
MCISYEIERSNVTHFIHAKVAKDATKKVLDLKLALANKEISDGKRELIAKRSMVRHISHEIRTPLNTTSIGVEVLEHELSALGDTIPNSLIEVVVGIRAACGSALVIVNELLTFEKLAAGLFTLECNATAVLPFVRDSMKEFAILAIAKNISLDLIHGERIDEEAAFDIDPVKMSIVLRNFLSNALKFTPRGGHVTMVVDHVDYDDEKNLEGRSVIITVTDSGVGISPENVRHLFEEGVQFNANTLQDGGGSGFGLYITKGIINLHKGASIRATSDGEGRGCSFHIQLPLLSRYSRQLNSYPSSIGDQNMPGDDIIAVSPKAKPLLLLVVDDSQANRKMMLRILKLAGHTAAQAADGLAAVREISSMLMKRQKGDVQYNQYDAVLMDSEMPKMSGPEATREMRAMGYLGPIIGVTGNTDHTEFNDAGADRVLLKPINLADVKKALACRRKLSDSRSPITSRGGSVVVTSRKGSLAAPKSPITSRTGSLAAPTSRTGSMGGSVAINSRTGSTGYIRGTHELMLPPNSPFENSLAVRELVPAESPGGISPKPSDEALGLESKGGD